MIEFGKKNIILLIERFVLLRMGFFFFEVKFILEGVMERGFIGKGVGYVVYKLVKFKNIMVREVGLLLVKGEYWDEVICLFREGVELC